MTSYRQHSTHADLSGVNARCVANVVVLFVSVGQQSYHPAAQDWLPTEAKQGWAWSVPGWETSWEN